MARKTYQGTIDPHFLEGIYKAPGNKGEGARNLWNWFRHHSKAHGGDDAPVITLENVSLKGLGLALGAIDPYNDRGSLMSNMAMYAVNSERVQPEAVLTESNPGVATNAFQVITSELIANEVIMGYDTEEGMIGDKLVRVMPNQRLRNQRITGITALAGPLEVNEGFPYEESGFEEKYVTTSETKKGRLLSINEELILFDQTGEIANRARNLGAYTRQERERVIVRGVTDADQAAGTYVYRPSGTGEALYATDGSNYNWIGSGNTTSTTFNAASVLADWTDLEFIQHYRATAITDDRVDGTARPIAGLTGPGQLLVPWALHGTALYITSASTVEDVGSSATDPFRPTFRNPAMGMVTEVLSSPFIDEQGGQAVNDYFFGQFQKTFVWTEIYPIQTFTQGADSEAAFERDVVMRIKVRYYGGITAVDPIYVTKIDGN